MGDCDNCGAIRPRWHGGKHICLFDDSRDTYDVGPTRYVLNERAIEFLRADYAGLR